MKYILRTSVFLLATLLAFGCVAHKKKGDEKVSKFKKGYHNITSKFNYWFNANELLTTTVGKMEAEHKDNYGQLLDVYPAVEVDPQPSKPDLDNVIKKASTAISLHRVGNWTDDCYMLIGQAQYLKKDYETAEATFIYFKEEHDPNKKIKKAKVKKGKKGKSDSKKKASKKKKKKKSSKKKSSKSKKTAKDKKAASAKDAATPTDAAPAKVEKPKDEPKPSGDNPYESGLFKRRAAYPMAMVWYGRTMTAREKYEEADYLFSELWSDPFFPKSLQDDLATAQAYNWIVQKKYDRAIPYLKKAIEMTKKKKQRARLAYILAQLYDRSGNHGEAYAAFETVLSSRPTYEMEFNARLNQIESAWENGKITSKDADKSLNRMLKDDKNIDYKDQIYFTLATIALKEGNKPDAVAYLREALKSNKGNKNQQAEAYLKLADLYFEAEDFVNAKNYFDSTLTVLPNADTRYKRADTYAKNLTDIARFITVIKTNDSIMGVYAMSDAERKDLAKKIKKEREAEAKAAELAEAAKAKEEKPKPGAAPAGKLTPQAGAKSSTFYFYNEAFVKKGKKDFAKKWNDRKLEDNWRRSQRRPDQGGGEEVASGDSTKTDAADADLGDIFAGIPANAAELQVLHMATYEAMYQLGTHFRDKIQNYRRSVGTLEEMQTRYPDTLKYQKETWYYCYLDHTDLNNPPKAKEYYDKLVGKYPNSAYARAISDPNFLNSQKQRDRELNDYYEQAYGKFKQGDYKTAFEKCQDAPRKYGSTNPLMSKFALLSALCTGNLQGKDAYCQALSDVIGRFPGSAEETRAKEIARLLSCKGFEVGAADEKKDGAGIDEKFALEDDKLHYFMVAIDNSEDNVKLDDIKASISDYNKEFHKLEQLRLSNIFLGTDTQTPIIVLRKFDNREQAMRYLNEVEIKKDFLGETSKKQYNKEFFVITQENYRRVLKNKTLDGYRDFFEENYRN